MCARVLLPHASAAAQVHVARFSADGARVFTASDDARAICWDVAAEAQVRTFEGHCDRVRSGRINPASADLFFTGALHGPRAALPPSARRSPPASRKLAIPLPSPGSSHPPATASKVRTTTRSGSGTVSYTHLTLPTKA